MSKLDQPEALTTPSSPAKRVYVKPRLVEIDLEAPTAGKIFTNNYEVGITFAPS